MPPIGHERIVPSPAWRSSLLVSTAALLAAGVIAAPLAFGATEVWGYCGLQLLVAAAVVCWILSGAGSWRGLWLPAAVAAVGAVQLIPLSGSMLAAVSPLSARAQAEARELTHRPSSGCVSVDVERTSAALRRCLMLALVVVMTAGVATGERLRRILFSSLMTIGVVILLLGLLVGAGPQRKALGFHSLDGYWKFYKNPLLSGFHSTGVGYADPVTVGEISYVSDSPIGGAAMGALINANHFAACIGLTLPVVVCGLMAWSIGPSRRKRILWPLAGAYTLVAVYAVAVPADARGATLSIFLTGLCVAGLAAARTRRRGIGVLIGLAVVVAGGAFALYQLGLAQRLGGRFDAWSAALTMFRQSPWLGVGLGNYGATYPFISEGGLFYLAHNLWLESVAEAGIVGIALVLFLLVALIWNVARAQAWQGPTTRRLQRLGMFGCLAFAAFHGALDHGVQIPGNAYLCAVLIGCLLGDVRSAGPNSSVARSGRGKLPAMLTALCFAGFLAYGGMREMAADRLMLPLRRAIAMQRRPGHRIRLDEKPELLRSALPDAQRAVQLSPRNAAFSEYLGQAYLHLSQGEPGPQLHLSDEWFSRSLRLCPVTPWIREALLAIRRQINAESTPADGQ
ncbi:MAG: O-antigen ligase domain-containing protein [Planctomycetaceae bacterium]|nr:O-antigen ligase domain-containing protein [Planctomycetaceae bacterium]